jgi:hypothetical protein
MSSKAHTTYDVIDKIAYNANECASLLAASAGKLIAQKQLPLLSLAFGVCGSFEACEQDPALAGTTFLGPGNPLRGLLTNAGVLRPRRDCEGFVAPRKFA